VSVAPSLRRSGHELELRHAGQRIGLARWDDGAIATPRLLDVALERPLPAGAVTLEAALVSVGSDRVLLDALAFPSLQQPLPARDDGEALVKGARCRVILGDPSLGDQRDGCGVRVKAVGRGGSAKCDLGLS